MKYLLYILIYLVFFLNTTSTNSWFNKHFANALQKFCEIAHMKYAWHPYNNYDWWCKLNFAKFYLQKNFVIFGILRDSKDKFLTAPKQTWLMDLYHRFWTPYRPYSLDCWLLLAMLWNDFVHTFKLCSRCVHGIKRNFVSLEKHWHEIFGLGS